MSWEILSQKYLIRNHWLIVREDCVKQPSGNVINDFYVLEYPDWVNVIAIDTEGRFIIEKQYRHGISETVFEICAGTVEHGEPPINAAKRELLEETGYGNGNWKLFMVTAPNTNSMNNLCYTFLATDVERVGVPNPESTEDIFVTLMTKQQVKEILEQDNFPEGVMSAPLWKFFALYTEN